MSKKKRKGKKKKGASPLSPDSTQAVPLADAPMIGRQRERSRISAAVAGEGLPQSLLLTGHEGIGKLRMALWTAQRLLCRSVDGARGPCSTCPDCRQAASLQHPDLVLYVPHGSPGSGTSDSQTARVDQARADAAAQIRDDALFDATWREGQYYAATGRALAAEARKPSVAGGRKVVILANAERLTPYEGASEASNALLKVLEEPADGMHLILTARSSHMLLPTVRSRVTEMRLAPLSVDEARQVVQQARPELDLSSDEVAENLMRSRGSLSRFRGRMDPAWREERRGAVSILAAGLSPARSHRYQTVEAQGFKGARGEFSQRLAHMEEVVMEVLDHLCQDEKGEAPELLRMLGEAGNRTAIKDPARWGRLLRLVMKAKTQARRNAGPLLILHGVLAGMEDVFQEESVARTVR